MSDMYIIYIYIIILHNMCVYVCVCVCVCVCVSALLTQQKEAASKRSSAYLPLRRPATARYVYDRAFIES